MLHECVELGAYGSIACPLPTGIVYPPEGRFPGAMVTGHHSAMDLYDYEAGLARRLLAWGAASVAGGAALAVVGGATGNRFLRGFGTQTIAWGAIDAGLALGGRARAQRLLAHPSADRGARAREATRIRRTLLVNAGLDVLYIAGGLAVAAGRGRTDGAARGHAGAAVVQGTFLLGFDAWHAARVPGKEGDAGRDESAIDAV